MTPTPNRDALLGLVGAPTTEEMRLACDELHGCMIRRPGSTCEVRKEHLATALYALDQWRRARANQPE